MKTKFEMFGYLEKLAKTKDLFGNEMYQCCYDNISNMIYLPLVAVLKPTILNITLGFSRC